MRPGIFVRLGLLLLGAAAASAQIPYSGRVYAQNFDGLPAAGTFAVSGVGPVALAASPINATGLNGWSFGLLPGSTGSSVRFFVDNGVASGGGTYSYGPTGSANRSLGSLASNAVASRFGAVFVNSGSTPIQALTVSYVGQQWRNGGSGTPNILRFSYAVGASDIANGTFVEEPSLHFAAPVATGAAGPLDGTATANQTALSAQLTGLAWAPGQTLVMRWTDVNDPGADDGLAIDDFVLRDGETDAVPLHVLAVSPADGGVNRDPGTALTVTFNRAATVTGRWFQVVGTASGAHSCTVSGGPVAYTLTPDAAFAFNETVSVTLRAALIADASNGAPLAADYSWSFGTAGPPPPLSRIHDVQGAGASSPLAGANVTIEGVVTASFQGAAADPGLRGFFVQEEDANADQDPATSEGIFVFDGGTAPLVEAGQRVRVVGTVAEFGGLTEISPVTSVAVLGRSPLPAVVPVTLPLASATALERLEGMRVTFPQTLTVTNNFGLGQYGEIELSAGGRLLQPTSVVPPGTAAIALQAANDRNRIFLDDGSNRSYPDPTPYLGGIAPTLRTGATVTGLTGVVTFFAGGYRIEPDSPVNFVDANPRSEPPAVGGSLRVVSANLLNYFNGNGAGGGFPTPRGADSATELARQRAKLLASLAALSADIYGLTEVENDGYGATSALQDLVEGLNALTPRDVTYAAIVPASSVGSDAIRCALIYRVGTVQPVGAAATTSAGAFGLYRPPIAQTFRQLSTGEKLTVVVNHFKSKAAGGTGADADQGDGQGYYNATRTQQSQVLLAWLATDPTASGDPDFLIIGDLNAYAMEDPITALLNGGYVDLTRRFEGAGGYSYAFGGQFGHLDHALATPSLDSQVTGAQAWHNNSDEPIYLDYNLENKTAAQAALNVGTPYRASDHDPVLIGIALAPAQAPQLISGPTSQAANTGTTVVFRVSAAGTPRLSYQWRKDGADIPGATEPTLTLTNVPLSAAGAYLVVVTNFAGSVTSEAASLTVNLTYATWSSGIPWPPGADTSPTGDVDGDGGSNLLEFVQDTDPLSASRRPQVIVERTSRGASATYRRRKHLGAVSAWLELSADLQTWTAAGSGTFISEADAETDLYQVTLPFSPSGQIFTRLRATVD